MKWLSNYRSGLQAAAGTGMDPSSMGQAAMSNASSAMNNSYNAYGGIVNAIGGLFDPYKNEKESLSTDLINILKGLV
jgi:hypothetical protein